ncbi:MAG: hypothetical protein GC191_06655 [Azospirillum sp.]|nr:hypothetical protein [Azospirillum sp.]
MDWPETLLTLVAALGLYAWAAVRERRPVDFARPRLIPPLPVMAIAAVIALLMLAHLVTLATGQPFRGGSLY